MVGKETSTELFNGSSEVVFDASTGSVMVLNVAIGCITCPIHSSGRVSNYNAKTHLPGINAAKNTDGSVRIRIWVQETRHGGARGPRIDHRVSEARSRFTWLLMQMLAGTGLL